MEERLAISPFMSSTVFPILSRSRAQEVSKEMRPSGTGTGSGTGAKSTSLGDMKSVWKEPRTFAQSAGDMFERACVSVGEANGGGVGEGALCGVGAEGEGKPSLKRVEGDDGEKT